MSKKMQSNILLLITAFIWGSAFVAQKSGMDYIEPFTFNGIRTLIGGLVLIPVVLIMGRGKDEALASDGHEMTDEERARKKRDPRSPKAISCSAGWVDGIKTSQRGSMNRE